MQRLVDLQFRIARSLAALCVLHVPILVAIAAFVDHDVATTASLSSLFAGLPLVFLAARRPIRMIGFALAVSLVAQTGILVALLAHTAWQVEMHFYFFVALAMLAGFCDLSILIGAAAFVAIHHLLLNSWLPSALFSGGTDFQRVVVHALAIVIETAVLAYISRQIVGAFKDADDAERLAGDASARAARAGQLIEQKLGTETARGNHLAKALDIFRTDISERLRMLGDASRRLYDTADELLQAAAHTKNRTETARLAAGEATANADRVAASGGTFFELITDIAHQATQSATMGARAVVDTTATADTIDELTQMSTQIEAIVNLIIRVADQTNLLALNATMEASRAGEHGRGFAVVAQEVKLLASKTSASVQSIGAMVAGIRSTTTKSVEAIDGVTRSIKGLNDATALIAEAAEVRVSAAATMTRDISRAASDVNIVCTAIGEIERVADETTQGANVLRRAAQDIADTVVAIEREVERYAADLRQQTQLTLDTMMPEREIAAA